MSLISETSFVVREAVTASRRLARRPGFSLLAIGTLTVALAINAGMFALVDAILLRPPFEVADPENVARLNFQVGDSTDQVVVERATYPTFADVKSSGAFQSVGAFAPGAASVGEGATANLVDAMFVSERYFVVLGTTPLLGSLHLVENPVLESGRGVVVSYGYWQRNFGGDPRVVGRSLRIDARPYLIAGVTRRGLQAPGGREVDLWLPLEHAAVVGLAPSDWRTERGPFWLSVLARKKPKVDLRATLTSVGARLQYRRAELGDKDLPSAVLAFSLVGGRDSSKPLEAKVALFLSGLSVLVLLIACANISNLLLTRIVADRREYLLCLSLGAPRWSLIGRAVAEPCVIVAAATVGALALSFGVRNAIVGFVPGDIPLSRTLWDLRTAAIVVACAVSVLAFVSVLVLPVTWATTQQTGIAGSIAGARTQGRAVRRVLLSMQSALCVVLVFVAGLFAQSLRRVEALDLGVDPDRTIQLSIDTRSLQLGPAETTHLFEQIKGAISGAGGAEAVALAASSPYMSGSGAMPTTAERKPEDLWPAGQEAAYQSTVGAGFFRAVGARSLRGRDFTDADDSRSEAVAIVNEPLARRLWGAQQPIGRCMFLDETRTCTRIVGVLGGVWKFSALQRDKMAVYLPLAQVKDAAPSLIFVRPVGKPGAVVSTVRGIVQSLYPQLPAVKIGLLRDIVDREFKPWRLGASLFSVFGLVAIFIGAVGLYSSVSVTTALRMREVGIRMTLGARWPQVVRAVAQEGILAVGAGVVCGMFALFVAARWIQAMLFQTSATDPGTLAVTLGVLAATTVVALMVPAVRALRANPTTVLRAE